MKDIDQNTENQRKSIVSGQLSVVLNILIAAVCVSVIAYLNFLLIRYWFIGEFNSDVGSIEISYIQMAKFWAEGGVGWQPWWYLGHPWHVFYTPLLPALELLAHNILGFSFAHAYRVITGLGYVLVPVSCFFFVWQITKSKSGAIVSALFYSFVPSLMAYLVDEVAKDVISGSLEPRRFTIMVRWGEGPHTLALAFLPLFGLFVSRYFEKRRFVDLFLAALFFALVALTNAIVVWAAVLLLLAFVLSQMVRRVEFAEIMRASFICLILSAGLLGFWYNLPFLSTFFKEGSGALTNWQALFPWGISLVFAGSICIFFAIKKVTVSIPGAPFAFFWFLMIFGIVYVYYASENHLEYAPQALRFNTEADLGLSILVGVLISFVFLRLNSFGRGALAYILKVFSLLIFAIPVLLLIVIGFRLISTLAPYTKSIGESKLGSVENTAEYKVAKNLTDLGANSQARVLAPGNYGFWLNYFSDVPQIRGALFQSSTNFWPEHIYYQITNGPDAQISLAWLKIANIGELVFTTDKSKEIYHDFRVPQSKFDSVLKPKLTAGGDIYYDVPLKNDSIAKIVDFAEILGVSKPTNAIDSKPIFAYLAALEKKADKKVVARKISDSRWHLSGELGSGEGILFQQTYDAGWKIEGGGWKKNRDVMDYLVLVPKNSGKFDIDLVYTKPQSVYIGYLITIITIGWIVNRLIRLDRGLSRLIRGNHGIG